METLWQDLKYALRGFRRTPGPFAVAALTMALGIGGSSAVFSVVDRILFRGLAFAHQERLVWFGMKAPIGASEFLLESDFTFFREHQPVFEEMTSISGVGDCDLNEAEPLRLVCGRVAANFLPAFGLKPFLGRNIAPEEDVPNALRTALITYGFWQRRFGGDPRALGRTMQIDGRPAQIVGVLPREFEMPTLARVDVLLPQQLNWTPQTQFTLLTAFGRLKPGIGLERARAALQPLFLESLKKVPAGFAKDVTFHMSFLRERQVRDYRTASLALLGCVAGVLLIACANVASLLLARAASRQREFAVRAAIGASRGRLMRQMLTESALLCVAGGMGGLAFAAAFLRGLVALAPAGIPRIAEAGLDQRVLLFAIAASLACGILSGIAPALRLPAAETLNTGQRVAGGGLRLRHSLVAVQIGLSFALLSGAGLLMQSLWNMQRVNPGMQPERVLTGRIQLGQQRYPGPAQQAEFFERLFASLQRLPGVRAAAMSDSVPLYGQANQMIFSNLEVDGRPAPAANRTTGGMTVFRTVSPGYFRTMGIRMARGREFTEADRTSSGHVVIIDERLARRLFPGEDAVGHRIRPLPFGASPAPWWTIVGVASDVKNAGLIGADEPEYYSPWRTGTEAGRRRGHILLRTEADAAGLAQLVQAEVARIDPALPITLSTMERNLGVHLDRPRFEGLLLCLFAAVGVALAAVGQYGVISFLVAQRSVEIGVRMALGATRGNIVSMVLGHTAKWTLLGAALGLTLALAAGAQLEPMLFGVKPGDTVNFAAVFAFLICVSLAAAWQPSRRAANMDPARALRHD